MFTVNARKARWLAICLALVSATTLVAAADLADKIAPKPAKPLTTVKAWQVVYTVPGSQPDNAWRYLQSLQVHLRELASPSLLSTTGCETNVEYLDCPAVEKATRGNDPKGMREVTSLTYYVDKTDWVDLEKVFTEAVKRANKEATSPGSPDFYKMKPTLVDLGDPACIPPYASPCYSRPVCTMIGKCSLSSTSCVPCNYP
jgi:hypothetical protein